jgi:hypothetical protein
MIDRKLIEDVLSTSGPEDSERLGVNDGELMDWATENIIPTFLRILPEAAFIPGGIAVLIASIYCEGFTNGVGAARADVEREAKAA